MKYPFIDPIPRIVGSRVNVDIVEGADGVDENSEIVARCHDDKIVVDDNDAPCGEVCYSL